MKMRTKSVRYFDCLCGEKSWTLDHLWQGRPSTSWGPWYCDKCLRSYHGDVLGEETTIKATKNAVIHGTSLLRLSPLDAPLHVLVKSNSFSGWDDSKNPDMTFLYEEHQCPQNIMHDVCDVFLGANQDPHGLFEWLGFAPEPYDQTPEADQRAFILKHFGVDLEDANA